MGIVYIDRNQIVSVSLVQPAGKSSAFRPAPVFGKEPEKTIPPLSVDKGILMHLDDADSTTLFDERFVEFQDEMYGFIASMLPRRNDADDVFQEASLKLLQNRTKYDSNRPFAPWAITIAMNEVRMFIRKNRQRGVMFSETMLVNMAEQQFRSDKQLKDCLDRLAECLEKLSAEKRQLLEACYSDTRSIKTIAVAMGMQPDALYKQLERIRRTLFDCMREPSVPGEMRDE